MRAEMRSLGDGGIHIHIYPAPGLQARTNDPLLKRHGISLLVGEAKTFNKSLIAENAMKELGLELVHISPDGGPVTNLTICLATANLNSRIRKEGLSVNVMWMQHDQVTGEQLPIDNRQIIFKQHFNCISSHHSSSKFRSHGKSLAEQENIHIGDLVYVKCDRDKTKARKRYLLLTSQITSIVCYGSIANPSSGQSCIAFTSYSVTKLNPSW